MTMRRKLLKENSTETFWERSKFKISFFSQRISTKIFKKAKLLHALFLSFLVPIVILFFLYPASFQSTWKGRTFYLFFLWLIILELALGWDDFQLERLKVSKRRRNNVLGVALVIPTLYVVVANYFGLNNAILSLAIQFNVPWTNPMPLSVEYLVFTGLFVAITILGFGLGGLKGFSISAFFLGAIGAVYMIDNLYPYGIFTPFQIFVPVTASLAAIALNIMGYQTSFYPSQGDMPILRVWNSQGSAVFGIAWPCSGVQSFFIYSVVILLFLKKTNIPWIHKVVYFAFGAVVTYFINILRIATIFIIYINQGKGAARIFHSYYGELYSMSWIIAYPLIIIGSRMFWAKIKPRLGVTNALRKLFRQQIPTEEA